jgi:hypothetical protein
LRFALSTDARLSNTPSVWVLFAGAQRRGDRNPVEIGVNTTSERGMCQPCDVAGLALVWVTHGWLQGSHEPKIPVQGSDPREVEVEWPCRRPSRSAGYDQEGVAIGSGMQKVARLGVMASKALSVESPVQGYRSQKSCTLLGSDSKTRQPYPTIRACPAISVAGSASSEGENTLDNECLCVNIK